jgi:hypothetical protein
MQAHTTHLTKATATNHTTKLVLHLSVRASLVNEPNLAHGNILADVMQAMLATWSHASM